MKTFIITAFAILLSGCTHLHSTDTTNSEPQNLSARGAYMQNTNAKDTKQVCKKIKRHKHVITRCRPVTAD
ncbi:hypothetical protein GCM10009347_40000 [Shewanella algicola]|uniref:Lipoprotein n=1 Tax=Shewanella algicola TaxID=640633 RepID=A0A9X1Z893_9GAMM|nr:hypothetical protein [Shewanella algicola]MCL1107613.1 hypothetical protein [Shewanella algicola]GGP70882.1 hypothetical protein GCM10009347_40000 [Shewanella algicola]